MISPGPTAPATTISCCSTGCAAASTSAGSRSAPSWSPTAAGRLYEVDTRLRPNGADGMLAVSLESFERYQREQAWTWEHMALLRARPIYGSAAGREALQRVIDKTLRQPRDPAR